MASSSSKVIVSHAELAMHNSDESGHWVKIGTKVYDVSSFHNFHPGGSKILKTISGTDASEQFWSLHRNEVIDKWGPRLAVGTIEGADEDDEPISLGEISEVPYAEHNAWLGFDSPYYTESHLAFREEIRAWAFREMFVSGIGEAHEISGEKVPEKIFLEMGRTGILAGRLGPGKHLKVWAELLGGKDPMIFGVKPSDFDYFHERILHEELARVGCPGFIAGCGDGHCIGCPPIFQFGPAWMQSKVLPAVLGGSKRICLAISEPQVGSDVASLHTTAVKSKCGTFYIVNGTKKWITGGHFADYFVTAVRTGGKGMGGISVLLLDRSMDGLRTKPIKTSYSAAAGTCLVILEDVRVPVGNLIGKENSGFMCIMYNFNHERWFINCSLLGSMRSIIEEAFKWIMQRRAFGKRLADQGVVRLWLAQMIAAVEPCVHWLDNITYQMNNMEYDEQAMRLAGTTSLCKYQLTRAANLVADKSVQLFGGRGITKQGMGRYIERFNVNNKFAAILGGSEEIMADLAIKMAMKMYPEQARL